MMSVLTYSRLPFRFSSVAQSCPTLCDPMNCSTPGFPVHHQLQEFTQTRVNGDSDAIQPSHPLSSPSSPAFNLSQHQGLFQWVSSSYPEKDANRNTPSGVLVWRIPGTGEPGGLPSMGSHSRVQLKWLSSSSSSHQVARGLEFQLQHQSFQLCWVIKSSSYIWTLELC